MPGSGPGEMVFLDENVEAGKRLFDGAPAFEADGVTIGTRRCGGCHGNAGANGTDGKGSQRATGVNKHPDAPACFSLASGDGGFDVTPTEEVALGAFCDDLALPPDTMVTFRGTQEVNTPSLIEAADTAPSSTAT
jgi:hypothetical protein